MCGIIGIINEKNVSHKLYYGLTALQHRGQDAAGIITSDKNELSVHKGAGLVHDVFTPDILSSLIGSKGVGHTRYRTAGSLSNDNIQPIFANSSNKIVLAHNGNITNYDKLKEDMTKECTFLSTTIDSEPLLHLFARTYEKTGDFYSSAKSIFDQANGSYAIVGVISDKGLFAIRDPSGIRPLVLGKKGNSYCVASESVALQTIGYDFERDIAPGEAILIKNDTLEIESKIIEEKKRAHCMFEWVYFSRPESMIETRAVYKARLALGVSLAKYLKEEAVDVVIPVPDTSRSCAIKLAEVLGVKYREGLIKNRYIGRTFIMPSQQTREDHVDMKLNVIMSTVKDQNIVLVDDSIVRGTTARRIVRKMKDAGAKRIILVSSCPPIKHPCYYGIDMSTEDELIANNKTLEEIKEYIGADRVIYATVEDLQEAIRRDLCTGCLTKEYPVEITDKEKELFRKEKQKRC